jgi:phosphoribosylanthranilate isomerase
MKVKVCGMRQAQNIAEIARIEPDYMGFIFYDRSPRFAGGLDPEVLNLLPAATKRVGVFVDAPEKYIREMAKIYGLDYLQLHGNESPRLCMNLKAGYGVIKAFGVERAEDLKRTAGYEGACDYFLFDTKTVAHGGSGRKFDHSILTACKFETPYLLSGGLSAADAASLTKTGDKRCVGFDLNSRFEITPGVKNPVLIKEFIETIKHIQHE